MKWLSRGSYTAIFRVRISDAQPIHCRCIMCLAFIELDKRNETYNNCGCCENVIMPDETKDLCKKCMKWLNIKIPFSLMKNIKSFSDYDILHREREILIMPDVLNYSKVENTNTLSFLPNIL